jgi:hypothetical protein
VSFFLIFVGTVLLVVCLTGVALGIYMALDGKNREPGVLFSLCWVSGAAGAAGVMMRDGVTFLIGTLCFLVAGAVFVLSGSGKTASNKRDRGGPGGQTPDGSEKTTRENRSGYRRAAS